MLEIVVYSQIMLIKYPQSLTNADILGQGNLNLLREKLGYFTVCKLWEPCEIILTQILFKRTTFVYGFMLQTLYFHLFR